MALTPNILLVQSKPSTTSIDHLTSTTDDPVQVDSQDVLELDYDEDGLIEQDEDNRSNSNKNRGEGLTTDKGTWKNLWISGLDQMMKANDLKAAFEPFGKGKISHTTHLAHTPKSLVDEIRRARFPTLAGTPARKRVVFSQILSSSSYLS